MGHFFTLVPVLTGFRCRGSDYGAIKAISPRYPASLVPLLEFSRLLRCFPATLSLRVLSIRQAQGKGRLRNVR
ncbi:hypothetical protein SRDD_07050 [Serratia sp. DD3]|nr:hypothetical protein SRDD_07050 [Serratia sp. DD3]